MNDEITPLRVDLGTLADEVEEACRGWDEAGNTARLFDGDAKLWTDSGEENWLGWLGVIPGQQGESAKLRELADSLKARFSHVVVLGMGGSSLCPDVFARSFGRIDGFPELSVVDSTVPAQVLATRNRLDLPRTLFIVASKSGSTTEPNVLYRYFRGELEAAGVDSPGAHFIAITDPGSALERLAAEDGFRHVALGDPTIGGRFSALSNFGMVPAALAGIDTSALLATAAAMRDAAIGAPAASNPAIQLGIILAGAAGSGRDKLTFVTSEPIASFGDWIEQLVAESTGKRGLGIVPCQGERLADEANHDHRLYIYTRLRGAIDDGQEQRVRALVEDGAAVVTIDLDEVSDLGREMFRWELATAVAGSLLGVNPFDQPDVEAAKIAARDLVIGFERDGLLPDAQSFLSDDQFQLFADGANRKALDGAIDVDDAIRQHIGRLTGPDYFALNAFIDMNDANGDALTAIRHVVRDGASVATTVGYGPRFLHSTGQLHKGGPATGLFLQITADDPDPVAIPGQKLTFAALKEAQARGDFTVLGARGRRALHLHIAGDLTAGLARLREVIEATFPTNSSPEAG